MKYFLMSQRFNKISAEDFGLITTNEPGIYLQPEEKSKWMKRDLYDLGWGPEIGFCRMPIPDFPQLFEMVLREKDPENRFGAAAIILSDYGQALLEKCVALVQTQHLEQYRDVFIILNLDSPVRYSEAPMGKCTPEEYCKWFAISQKIMPYLPAIRKLPY